MFGLLKTWLVAGEQKDWIFVRVNGSDCLAFPPSYLGFLCPGGLLIHSYIVADTAL